MIKDSDLFSFESAKEEIEYYILQGKGLVDFLKSYFVSILPELETDFIFLEKDFQDYNCQFIATPSKQISFELKRLIIKKRDSFIYNVSGDTYFFFLIKNYFKGKKVFFILSCKNEFLLKNSDLVEIFIENSVLLFKTLKNPIYSKNKLSKLIANEEMYRGVFEYTGTGTIILNYEMVIIHSNEKFSELTGYKREEIEHKKRWSDFVAPDFYELLLKYHYGRRNYDPEIPEEYECAIIDNNKNRKVVFMKVGMIPGTEKSIASFMDITKRKKAEMRLKSRESQLSLIVENFNGLIYIINKNYEIDFINKGFENPKTKHSELKCFSYIFGFDSICPWCSVKKVLKGKIENQEVFSPKDNKWYSVVSSPIVTFPDQISKVQTILTDITQRKTQEEKLKESAKHLQNENIKLKSSMKERYKLGNIIGKSFQMQEVYERILKAAESNAHVIIYGESGTGKELAAKEIHRLSSRNKENFVPVNCGAISEKLIESEFFGYRKGAFTGANFNKKGFLDEAHKGTLFLDEIGDIGLNTQVKLLRAIDDNGYTPVGGTELIKNDLRIVAATNRNLKELVKERIMREDFFYRIHVIPIKLPALRDRKDDIPILTEHCLGQMGLSSTIMPGRIMDAFLRYSWPGNIRELQNVIKRYVALGDISPLDKNFESDYVIKRSMLGINRPLNDIMDEFEQQIILKALEKNKWHRQKTAQYLGLNRKTLFKKIKKYNLG